LVFAALQPVLATRQIGAAKPSKPFSFTRIFAWISRPSYHLRKLWFGIAPASAILITKKGTSMSSQANLAQDTAGFNALLAQYQREINPQGAIQQTLFEVLVGAAWNLRRIHILKAALDTNDPGLARLKRFQSRFKRSFRLSLKELRALQADSPCITPGSANSAATRLSLLVP
jgi:hypothetical protein